MCLFFRSSLVAGVDLVGVSRGELEAKKPQPQGEVYLHFMVLNKFQVITAHERISFSGGPQNRDPFIQNRNPVPI